MIVITGASGFIASAVVAKLNELGVYDLILVDEFSTKAKLRNLENKRFELKIHRDLFPAYLEKYPSEIEMIIHLGARTDTSEKDEAIFEKLNISYSKKLWQLCSENDIPFIYASSAATYGDPGATYIDDEASMHKLQPLNPYGWSKQKFDLFALDSEKRPSYWVGLKFFNVYGPNEYHKSRMASVVFHAYNQIKKTGAMKLFRSHRADIANGQQSRDFIYVKDVVEVIEFFRTNKNPDLSGIYNLGTGKADSFLNLTKAVFAALNLPEEISFIDTPEDIRDTYQYYTQADIEKLRGAGYTKSFMDLSEGVKDYIENYLSSDKTW